MSSATVNGIPLGIVHVGGGCFDVHSIRCWCETCARLKADHAVRMYRRTYAALHPISPVAVARDASAGATTSSVDQSSPVLATLDTHPQPATAGVSGLPEPEPAARAAVGEPRLGVAS